MHQTLLLNATYEPLMIINWQRALTLVYLGKSEVLEAYHDRSIRCVREQMSVPSVLRLRERVRTIKPTVRFSRQNVYTRDEYHCQYCAESFKGADLTYDHVIPRSKGGKTSWTNIVTCCVPCNRRKRDRTPAQAGMRLLKTPIKPTSLSYRKGFNHSDPPPSWRFYLGRAA